MLFRMIHVNYAYKETGNGRNSDFPNEKGVGLVLEKQISTHELRSQPEEDKMQPRVIINWLQGENGFIKYDALQF
jgi:hypothetical protein